MMELGQCIRHDGVKSGGSFTLHSRQNVCIGIKRYGYAGMPQTLRNHFHIDAITQ